MTTHDTSEDFATTTPDRLVTLPDGRVVGVDERGPADGPVVVFLHSSPGSRRIDPDPSVTAATGIRLVTIDRAGYGVSSPVPADEIPSIAGRADDVAATLGALGIDDCALVGWSMGGQVALGVAARHPHLVGALVLAGTPAHDDDVPWVPEDYRPLLQMMRADPASARATLVPALQPLAEDADAAFAQFTVQPADAALVERDPRARAAAEAMLREAHRQGADNMACDIAAMHVVPWGFDPAAVGAATHLFYGEDDVLVPPTHGRHWAEVLPDATRHEVAGAGHLVPLVAWDEIVRSLLSERSR